LSVSIEVSKSHRFTCSTVCKAHQTIQFGLCIALISRAWALILNCKCIARRCWPYNILCYRSLHIMNLVVGNRLDYSPVFTFIIRISLLLLFHYCYHYFWRCCFLHCFATYSVQHIRLYIQNCQTERLFWSWNSILSISP
jgi:hypothetical protein